MSLERLFTKSEVARIIDILWEYQDLDLMQSEITEEADVHYTTLIKTLQTLERLNIVKITNEKLYKLNKDDELVKKLISFLNLLNIRFAEIESKILIGAQVVKTAD